ncbi:MAG: hypothetical protein LBT38_03830 [Deltaproteobacteria bacterium]|jgi:hypothetical protein|nr:hypothetical protein [Deltaproteobacteria bacterium]
MFKSVTKIVCIWSLLGWLFLGVPLAKAEPANESPAVNQTQEPKLSIKPFEDDEPETARFKAGLRLLAGFSQVHYVTQSCNAQENVIKNYVSRNGSVFARIFGSLKKGGAFDDKYRALVDEEARVASQAALRVGCPAALKDIEDGGWDLYKGVRFNKDYKLFSGR